MMFFCNIFAFNNYIFKSINSHHLRNIIKDDLQNKYKKISWVNAKNILHNEFNNSDIYGDNLHKKNVEHIFPQVYFKNNLNKNLLKSDIHNLHLCSEKLNCQRQHFKFIDYSYLNECTNVDNFKIINSDSNTVNDLNEFLTLKHDVVVINKKDKLFIPSLQCRGSIARSLAYFSVKYDLLDDLNKVIDIDTMIKWNKIHPVNYLENHKNIIGLKYHDVSNPFINNPELMNYCFKDLTSININELHEEDNLYSINKLIEEVKINKFENKKILKNINKKLN